MSTASKYAHATLILLNFYSSVNADVGRERQTVGLVKYMPLPAALGYVTVGLVAGLLALIRTGESVKGLHPSCRCKIWLMEAYKKL